MAWSTVICHRMGWMERVWQNSPAGKPTKLLLDDTQRTEIKSTSFGGTPPGPRSRLTTKGPRSADGIATYLPVDAMVSGSPGCTCRPSSCDQYRRAKNVFVCLRLDAGRNDGGKTPTLPCRNRTG